MNAGTQGAAARRILVVEDEMFIAVLIEEVLQKLGFVVVGPVGRLDAALRLASREALDGAILDVTIRGGLVFPVAETLLARGMPFVLATGQVIGPSQRLFRISPGCSSLSAKGSS
jgi:DNA-binding response OmpR family regulator